MQLQLGNPCFYTAELQDNLKTFSPRRAHTGMQHMQQWKPISKHLRNLYLGAAVFVQSGVIQGCISADGIKGVFLWEVFLSVPRSCSESPCLEKLGACFEKRAADETHLAPWDSVRFANTSWILVFALVWEWMQVLQGKASSSCCSPLHILTTRAALSTVNDVAAVAHWNCCSHTFAELLK